MLIEIGMGHNQDLRIPALRSGCIRKPLQRAFVYTKCYRYCTGNVSAVVGKFARRDLKLSRQLGYLCTGLPARAGPSGGVSFLHELHLKVDQRPNLSGGRGGLRFEGLDWLGVIVRFRRVNILIIVAYF